MIKRVPLLDPTSGQQFQLTGDTTDIVPNDRTVYIDQQGNTYDPSQRKVSFNELPEGGVLELPRTTWCCGDEAVFKILQDGTIVPGAPHLPTTPDEVTQPAPPPDPPDTVRPDDSTLVVVGGSPNDTVLIRLPAVGWYLREDTHPLSVDEGSR